MNTSTEPNHAANLFGGLTAAVVHEDGSTESVKVRQLPLRDYERAFPILDDEIAMTAFCVERTANGAPVIADKNWILTVQPHSYSELVSKAEHVNKSGFFSYAARRKEKEQRSEMDLYQRLSELPPEALKQFSEIGKSLSTAPSPQPRRVSR